MDNISNDFDLERLIQEVKQLMGRPQAASAPAQNLNRAQKAAPTGYQAPIKGSFQNSGGFTPNVYLNPKHPKGHVGVDMRAPGGTAIYPMAPGVVTAVGPDPVGGNTVNVQHANGVRTYYAHMGTINVHKGDRVDNNTILGTVGDSGNAKNTMPHLHLQVWSNGQIQDPARYFSMPKYTNFDPKKEHAWLSDAEKTKAQRFSIRDHVSQNRQALASVKIDRLEKIATIYYEFTTR